MMIDPTVPQTPSSPRLSILIPTKDRYETLLPVVREIVASIDDPRLEIVVCDNSAATDPATIARLTVDPRVAYYHSPDLRSVVDNSEAGIALCRGDYVCFIGDDDLVSPHIMAIVDWLDSQGEDSLIYPPARYWWASVHFAKESRYQRPGVFWLPKARSGAVARLDSAVELSAVLARGGVAYLNLPRLYHGIVSRKALARIHTRFGRYVPGSSPDMALSVALALTCPTYLSIAYPVTVFGAARGSGGGRTAAGKHHGAVKDQAHLPRNILARWDPRLPRIWSEQSIYAQTIHEVTVAAGVTNTISYPTLYGSLIVYEPHILRVLAPTILAYLRERPLEAIPLAVAMLKKGAGRLRVIARRATGVGMPVDLDVFADIGAVMAFMEQLPPPPVATAGTSDRDVS